MGLASDRKVYEEVAAHRRELVVVNSKAPSSRAARWAGLALHPAQLVLNFHHLQTTTQAVLLRLPKLIPGP